MKISSETVKVYGEKPGWYEGRVSQESGRMVLSQGNRYAYIDEAPELREHIGEVIFVRATLSINPEDQYFVLRNPKQFADFLGKYKEGKYLGKSGDKVIHSEKLSCDETKQTGLLQDVNIKEDIDFPLW